jgi:hypothetical protein
LSSIKFGFESFKLFLKGGNVKGQNLLKKTEFVEKILALDFSLEPKELNQLFYLLDKNMNGDIVINEFIHILIYSRDFTDSAENLNQIIAIN